MKTKLVTTIMVAVMLLVGNAFASVLKCNPLPVIAKITPPTVVVSKQSFKAVSNVYSYYAIDFLATRTSSGLYTNWTITLQNDTATYTWNTNDSSQGSISNDGNNFEFRGYAKAGLQPGIYTVTIQANDWGAYRDDLVVGGVNDTGSSVWNYDAYDNAYVVTGVELGTDTNDSIGINTTTNY